MLVKESHSCRNPAQMPPKTVYNDKTGRSKRLSCKYNKRGGGAPSGKNVGYPADQWSLLHAQLYLDLPDLKTILHRIAQNHAGMRQERTLKSYFLTHEYRDMYNFRLYKKLKTHPTTGHVNRPVTCLYIGWALGNVWLSTKQSQTPEIHHLLNLFSTVFE